jgi:hypothetical protein
MLSKKQIIKSIATLARKLGHTPSILEFSAHVKISRYSLFRLFPKWNNAVRAAGLKPHRLHSRPEDIDLLEDWGKVVRKKGAIPSPWTYRLAGKFYSLTLAKRFGGWDSVPQAFRKFAKGKREWRDVLALLPAPVPKGKPVPAAPCRGALQRVPTSVIRTSPNLCHDASFKNRATYGNPIHLQWFRHEPVNEQGVVLLFGMLAKDLGYMIEAVQKGFPDCEAKREVAPGRWQRVNIEFEFESKNFHDHGHSVTGCDIIVCWRHNWLACPKHIEVLELSRVIKALSTTED